MLLDDFPLIIDKILRGDAVAHRRADEIAVFIALKVVVGAAVLCVILVRVGPVG